MKRLVVTILHETPVAIDGVWEPLACLKSPII